MYQGSFQWNSYLFNLWEWKEEGIIKCYPVAYRCNTYKVCLSYLCQGGYVFFTVSCLAVYLFVSNITKKVLLGLVWCCLMKPGLSKDIQCHV